MSEFGEFRGPHGDDFNVKGQGLARELMVAVEDGFLVVDVADDEDAHAEIGFGMEAHADFDFVLTKAIQRDALD